MSECVREMTLQEKAESIINLINHKDINAEYLYNWQIDAMKEMCEKQIPKKPILYGDSEDGKLLCPSCEDNLWDIKECGFSGCPYCLQAIDWGDEDE